MLAASLAAAVVVVLPGSAGAASADESRLVDLSNGVRASAGVPALAVDGTLSAVARSWAATMAAAGTISHNPTLGTQLTGWTKIAENVGMGPDLDTVHRALVASPPHYANLTDPQLTLIGVGVVSAGGSVFVVEDFMRPAGAVSTNPVAPATTVAPTTVAPRATVPPTTVARARPAAAPTTTVPAVPAAAAAAPPPTTVVAPATAADPPPAPSDWLALALELTRGWQRALG